MDENLRGQSGEMTITNLKWRDPLCDAFIKGAESIGIREIRITTVLIRKEHHMYSAHQLEN